MAKKPFHLSIVTPEGSRFEGEIVSLIFPGDDGAVGVWAHHAPMLSAVRPGKLEVEEVDHPEVRQTFAVGAGFAEVSENRAILLVDTSERAEEIDVQRAKAALERAKELLHEAAHDESIDVERAEEAKERAEARLRAGFIRGETEASRR